MRKAAVKPYISAQTIQRLLAVKHAKDVFVPECKDGPTWYGAHLRMDAWAMKRSWSKPLCIGYEIKISRADFLKDDKWQGYLDYCNEFYFVTTDGVCEPGELPPEVGLIRVSKTGTRLYIKKRAQRRAVAVPENVWRYIVMCRSNIVAGNYYEPADLGLEYWTQWLVEKDESKKAGHALSRAVGRMVEQRHGELRKQNDVLHHQQKALEPLRAILSTFGIKPPYGSWGTQDKLRRQLENLNKLVTPDVYDALLLASGRMKDLLDEIIDCEAAQGKDGE